MEGDRVSAVREAGYGPVVRRTRAAHRGQAPRVATDWADAACGQLDPRVAARYFGAGIAEHFEAATARAICARCPILVDCLADAIARPLRRPDRTAHQRAGMSAWALAALADEARRSGVPPRRIAEREAALLLPPLRGAYGRPDMRAGHFVSPELIEEG